MIQGRRLSNCMLYPAGLYGARSVIFTYTKTILVWFYTPSMNHGKRSAKGRFGKKDELIKEIEKMRDYCQRWIDVEKGR